ncbi:hypothetical protein TNCV_1287541 [Trichonephila clavipes]|nr:hypothetical protein TNCV_1287541 [Trichonephila clavipes]
MDLGILNRGQVTNTTPELASNLPTTLKRVQQRVQTEWNVGACLPKRLIRSPTKRITHTINIVFYHENLTILASLRYNKVLFSFKVHSHWWIDFDVGG